MPRMKPNLPPEEIERIVAEVQKTKNYPICGFVSQKSDGTITVCKLKAGAGTHHPGEGRCRKHGGAGRPITSGSWVIYKSGQNMKTLFEKAQELHLKQIQDHMETLKLIKVIVDELSQTTSLDPARVDELLKSLAILLKAEELQLKAQEKNMLTFEQVVSFMNQIIIILEEEIKDLNLLTRILAKMKEKVVLIGVSN